MRQEWHEKHKQLEASLRDALQRQSAAEDLQAERLADAVAECGHEISAKREEWESKHQQLQRVLDEAGASRAALEQSEQE